MAPLYTRLLFQAIREAWWDAPLGQDAHLVAHSDLQSWLAQVPLLRGRTWKRRSHVHFLAGDVSEEAYDGHSSLLGADIWQSFTGDEVALVQSNEFHLA